LRLPREKARGVTRNCARSKDIVTATFNALDTLVIKDDFYPDPDAVRALALGKTYAEPPAGTPQLAVTAICNESESKAMYERLAHFLPQVEANPVVGVNILFRYTLANAKKKIFCHVDGCSGAGIVYLSKPEHCAGGTTIYRHKPTGDEIFNKQNRQLYDFRDPGQWEVIKEVEMVYNRLVIYPGQLFHAITPVFFGDRIDNARLTQNIFVYRKHDRELT
jgi:hypothetical protein